MSGTRKPMDVNLAVAGGKHWTKAEIEARQRSEVKVDRPKRLNSPKWLCDEAKKLFRAYAKELIANLPVSILDVGTLARLCDAEVQYQLAAKKRDEAYQDDDLKGYEFWCKAIVSFEKIAKGAANDLGCTISSRCRMVVPQTQEEEDDPLEALRGRFNVV